MPTLRIEDGVRKPCTNNIDVEITLEEWRAGVRPEAGKFALALPNDAEISEVAETLSVFSAIVLEFPTFKDGRAYSQARLLRERYGYGGEIRARGDLLRDQAFFMARAGFDAFEIECADAGGFTEALRDFSYVYQPAADGAEPVWRLRAARAAAA